MNGCLSPCVSQVIPHLSPGVNWDWQLVHDSKHIFWCWLEVWYDTMRSFAFFQAAYKVSLHTSSNPKLEHYLACELIVPFHLNLRDKWLIMTQEAQDKESWCNSVCWLLNAINSVRQMNDLSLNFWEQWRYVYITYVCIDTHTHELMIIMCGVIAVLQCESWQLTFF